MNPFVISLAVRLTILLLAGGLMAVAVQRSTSATRHLVLASTLACVIALPITMIMVPEWRVSVLPATPEAHAIASALAPARAQWTTVSTTANGRSSSALSATVTASASRTASTSANLSMTGSSIHPVLVASLLQPEASGSSLTTTGGASTPASATFSRPPLALTPPQIALGVWLLGVVLGLAWIAIGRLGLARVRRRATPLTTYEWRTILEAEAMHAGVARPVALFTSAAVSMPVTWGVLSPVIVLPESAHAWSHDRKRVVVMHEMAHIARRDSATQFLATIACVAYWLHPLVILAARRLRAECERACDERVLERGTPAAEYAAHLLDVARLSRSFGAASIVSVAMARPSQLEGRLLAVLRAEPRHSRMSGRARVVTALSAGAMLVAISAFKPVAREARARDAHVRDSRPVQQAIAHTHATRGNDTVPVVARMKMMKGKDTVPAIAPAAPVSPVAPAPYAPMALAAPAIAAAPVAAPAQIAPVVQAAPAFPAFPGFRNFRDSTFEKSVPARSGGTLDIDLDTGGDIVIIGSDDSMIRVQGTLSGADVSSQTITLEGSSGDARLESRFEHATNTESSADSFTIRVPKKYNVHVSSAGGTISIKDVDGTFRGSTGGGNIGITNAHGTADLSTGGGAIRIANSHLDGSVMTGSGPVMFHDVTGSIVEAYSSRRASGTAKVEMPESQYRRKMSIDIDDDSEPPTRGRIYRERARTMSDSAWAGDLAQVEKMRVMINDSTMVKMRKSLSRARIAMMKDTVYVGALKNLNDFNRDFNDSSIKYSKRQKVYMKHADSTMLFDLEPYRLQLELSKRAMDDARQQAYMTVQSEMLPLRHRVEIDTDEGDVKDGDKHFIVIDKSGGSVQIREAPHGAHVVTGGGAISIGPSNGAVSAITGGGDIEIGPSGGSTQAATGAGDVEITMADGDPHPVNVATGKGDVEVRLPKDANVTLDLETAYTQKFGKHTKITGDWPLTVTESPDWDSEHGTPRKYVRVREKLGHGGPVIRVRTVNGDIRLTRVN